MREIEGIQENLRRGLTEMLVLCLLTEEDKYGYQLLSEIKTRTDGLFDLNTASLYGPLYRLQAKHYVTEYVVSAGIRRKRTYYHLTKDGLRYYKLMLEEYKRTHYQVSRMVGLDFYGREEQDNLLSV